MVPVVESVNVGIPRRLTSRLGVSGIDKRPVAGPVSVRAPGPKGVGGSGLEGDAICDLRHHGGDTQAVYAFAREDLVEWEADLGGQVAGGMFGENLTTAGMDISGALVGERWLLGADLVLQVTDPRVPCRTFAAFLGRRGWIKTFTERAAPGTYLRVVSPGEVRRGDAIEVIHRPLHDVTVRLAFRALTTEPERFVDVLRAGDDLSPELRRAALRRSHSAV